MAIELSNLTFTEQDDVVPASGVERIFNTGVANTLAGNDIINGETGNTIYYVGLPLSNGGIVNTGTLNTDGGNDRLTGLFNDQTSTLFTTYSISSGIYNVNSLINTGDGNDTLTGILDIQNPTYAHKYYGIFNKNALIDTGEGDDKIISINNITNTSFFDIIGIENFSGTFNTGNGNDIIMGDGYDGIANYDIFNTDDGNDTITGIATGFGILNFGPINTGDGDDIISGTSQKSMGIANLNNGSIDTGDGNDIITTRGAQYVIYNSGSIDTGNGNDSIIVEQNGFWPFVTNSKNEGIINTNNGNDSLIFHGGLSNSGSVFLGDGNDSIAADAEFPKRAIENLGFIGTGDGNDTITSTGVIYNEGVIETGKGDDSIIVDGGIDGITGTRYGIYNNRGAINMGDGNDSIIANEGFQSAPNSGGAWFLGEGDDYIKGYGSGDFYGGNGNDTLELTPGTYTVGIWGEGGESPIFTKGDQLMITSEFEKLKAGSTIYDFTSLIAGQIIVVA